MALHPPSPALIQKEIVPYLHFPKNDVLFSESERRARSEKLNKATSAGNLEHTKVKIIFEDMHGLKEIQTTIWATTENNIVLKRGATIPIHRIRDIQYI